MSGSEGISPAAVPERATRTGETPDRGSWVEPLVWTERMLTTLDKGVKGGKWYSLIITGAGQLPSLPSTGSSACRKPMPRPVSPLGGKTTDWRAGCGRSARPVRRAGRANNPSRPLSRVWLPQVAGQPWACPEHPRLRAAPPVA